MVEDKKATRLSLKKALCIFTFILLILLPSYTSAVVILLQNGQKIEGKIEKKEKGYYHISDGINVIIIPSEQVKEIIFANQGKKIHQKKKFKNDTSIQINLLGLLASFGDYKFLEFVFQAKIDKKITIPLRIIYVDSDDYSDGSIVFSSGFRFFVGKDALDGFYLGPRIELHSSDLSIGFEIGMVFRTGSHFLTDLSLFYNTLIDSDGSYYGLNLGLGLAF